MQRPSWRERARYAFDNYMARGPRALILALLVFSVVMVLVVWGITYGLGLVNSGDPDPLLGLWYAILGAFEPGQIGNDAGSPGYIVPMFALSLGATFFVAILIGIVATGVQGKVTDLRKGRSRVIEDGHVVILGWSQQIFAVIGELVEANANHRGSRIVVLADMDKVDMEDQIRARIPHTKGTRIVCRTGSPIDPVELDVANVQSSRAIIVLSPQNDDPDSDVIKTLLAITNDPHRRQAPYHIVAEICDARNMGAARMVGREEAELALGGDLIARITAQTCRQPGLSVVYTELLDFEGDEIYMAKLPALAGKTFGEALQTFEDSALIGLVPKGGQAKLNPPMDTVIGPEDQVIAISEDDDTVRLSGLADLPLQLDAITSPAAREEHPERTLILGWNRRTPQVLRELDHYLAPGSEARVVADLPSAADAVHAVAAQVANQRIEFQLGDTTDRGVLDALGVEAFEHVVIVSYADVLDVHRADARTLVTLLHLRDIAARTGHPFSIVSEMLDVRNRALAEVARADDFIVSDRLISLYVTQIAENGSLQAVFADLFDAEGSEIFIRPASDYVRAGTPASFYTVVESARRRNEVAIGYRLKALANDADHAYGVVINPDKSVPVTFSADDRVIVLAEK